MPLVRRIVTSATREGQAADDQALAAPDPLGRLGDDSRLYNPHMKRLPGRRTL
ncbi:MAG TPA: hypothetical protein VJQ46_03275 [Gemmatimonadales bacterium]|nr:hypothetical protein [Gemmatimonadales bacterium]